MTTWAINDVGDRLWGVGCGGGRSDIVRLNKEMVTNQDAAGLTHMFIFIGPLLTCALLCIPAPKPEDGETGEDFFERVGRISPRVNSMLMEEREKKKLLHTTREHPALQLLL